MSYRSGVDERCRERGASLLEFAVVLPLFLILLLGIFYFGIAFATQQAVNFAAERGAESAVSVDPDALIDSNDNVNPLVSQLANNRIRGVLGYFPGVDSAFPADGAGVVAIRVSDAVACGDDNGEGGATVKICVVDDVANTDSRWVQVRVSPRFEQLWPGFPQPGFFLAPEFVGATGSASVAEASDANGSG